MSEYAPETPPENEAATETTAAEDANETADTGTDQPEPDAK